MRRWRRAAAQLRRVGLMTLTVATMASATVSVASAAVDFPSAAAAGLAAAGEVAATPGAILSELKRVRATGRVLHVAAHPDDENTRLIAYLANGRHYATGYLSLTRGDGGQNLIGPELRDELGLIRTQELIAARRVDGGRQFFTRANDFGFSKSVDETLRVWDREQVLADTVRVIRTFRPHVIVNRFSPVPGTTHGHHTASSVLALEAFAAAADPAALREHVGDLPPWQVTRVVWNAWRPGGLAEASADPALVTAEVGGFDALRGESFGEIAARSRSEHRSQGFGAVGTRGMAREFFSLQAGEPMTGDLMDGVELGWAQWPGGAAVEAALAAVIDNFDARTPGASVPGVLRVRAALDAAQVDAVVAAEKRAQLDAIVAACLGLYAEATVGAAAVTPGETVELRHTVIVRNTTPVPVAWASILDLDTGERREVGRELAVNVPAGVETSRILKADTVPTHPYWLERVGTPGMFVVEEVDWIGTPENGPVVRLAHDFTVGGELVRVAVAPVEVIRDPVRGEIRRALHVIPPVTVAFAEALELWRPGQTKTVRVSASAARAGVAGELRLELPAGWRATPATAEFELGAAGARAAVEFAVTAAAEVKAGGTTLGVVAEMAGRRWDRARREIVYDHIPTQVLQPPARLTVVATELATRGERVGFLPGAGDGTAEALGKMGYVVRVLDDADLTPAGLAGLDAVVLGIRSLNTRPGLPARLPALWDYAAGGGVVIMQYLTTAQLPRGSVGPYALTISRERVTDETAAVELLRPEHPALRGPNRITAADFEGWVQERGLYFASEWDEAYEPLLGMADEGEPPRLGSLLVARHGRGWFVYTGLSFFRQLPAGVPGAWRLWANLVSLGGAEE